MIIVIGSGPAGVSASHALLSKGEEVLMLDVGKELEPEREALVRELVSTPSSSWDENTLRAMSENTSPDVKGLPKKLVYGSDYPFWIPEKLVSFVCKDSDIFMSHAKGGLSNVWGANMLPLMPQDIQSWPIGLKELIPFYEKVSSFVDIASREDSLTSVLPLYGRASTPLPQSQQALGILEDLGKNREALSQSGISFGQSRLAIRVHSGEHDEGCIKCGLCLYGCPYGLIYSSAFSLPFLQKMGNFSYKPGVFVTRIEESATGVIVHGRDVSTGAPLQFSGTRALLGAGTLASTRIVAESLEMYGVPFTVRDSQYFLTPYLRLKGAPGVTTEKLQTLSQICIEILDKKITPKSVHLLIYTYNDLYYRALKKLSGPLFAIAKPFIHALLERLIVVQGYLHSDDSPHLTLTVEKGERPSVVVRGVSSSRAMEVSGKILKKIWGLSGILKGMPIPFMTHRGIPGKSYHAGGTFPMMHEPKGHASDTLGRPLSMKRVHLIDSSCFPNIPATNITFTVMANAYRIGSAVAESQ